jgi:hypothetical protein
MSNVAPKLLIVLIILLPVDVFSQEESPFDMFSVKKNLTKKTTITWEYVSSDINERCNEESRRLGLKGFTVKLDACAFWRKSLFGNTCHIITSEKVNMWIIGHEMRHCFQGGFH